MSVDLSNYVEVSERIAAFREKHPEGSFQTAVVELPEAFRDKFVAVEARVYRTPDDSRPGVDVAWEPVPGKTTFTRDSELMNASTSAVGRAIVYALAADAQRGIASKDEAQRRSNGAVPADAIKGERVTRIGKAIGTAGLTYKEIDVLLGSCGIDSLRAGSGKALRERVESLSTEQADALEAELG